MRFQKIKAEFQMAELELKIDRYSFESMRYKMEKAKRSPLTQSEWKKIYDQSEEIKKINCKITKLQNK